MKTLNRTTSAAPSRGGNGCSDNSVATSAIPPSGPDQDELMVKLRAAAHGLAKVRYPKESAEGKPVIKKALNRLLFAEWAISEGYAIRRHAKMLRKMALKQYEKVLEIMKKLNAVNSATLVSSTTESQNHVG